MTKRQEDMLKSARLSRRYCIEGFYFYIAWLRRGVYDKTPLYQTKEQAYSAFYLLVAIEGGYVLGGGE